MRYAPQGCHAGGLDPSDVRSVVHHASTRHVKKAAGPLAKAVRLGPSGIGSLPQIVVVGREPPNTIGTKPFRQFQLETLPRFIGGTLTKNQGPTLVVAPTLPRRDNAGAVPQSDARVIYESTRSDGQRSGGAPTHAVELQQRVRRRIAGESSRGVQSGERVAPNISKCNGNPTPESLPPRPRVTVNLPLGSCDHELLTVAP